MSKRKPCYPPHSEQPFEKCIWCKEKINPSFQEKLDAEVASVPLETKQKILDLLHEGKTVGETRDAVGLSLLVVGEIVMKNIGKIQFLRTEAV